MQARHTREAERPAFRARPLLDSKSSKLRYMQGFTKSRSKVGRLGTASLYVLRASSLPLTPCHTPSLLNLLTVGGRSSKRAVHVTSGCSVHWRRWRSTSSCCKMYSCRSAFLLLAWGGDVSRCGRLLALQHKSRCCSVQHHTDTVDTQLHSPACNLLLPMVMQ